MDHWDYVIIAFLGLVAAISVQKFLITPSVDRLADCCELSSKLIFENNPKQSKFSDHWVWNCVVDHWVWTCVVVLILLVAAISIQKLLKSTSDHKSHVSPTRILSNDPKDPKYYMVAIFSRLGMKARYRFAFLSTSTWGWMVDNELFPPEFWPGYEEIKQKSSHKGWHMFYKEKEKNVNIYILQDGKLNRVFKEYEAIDLDPSWYVCWVDDGMSFDILTQVPDAVCGISIETVAVIRSWGVEGLHVKIREVTKNDG